MKNMKKRVGLIIGLLLLVSIIGVIANFGFLKISLFAVGLNYLAIIYFIDNFLKATRAEFWQIPLLYVSLTVYLAMVFVMVLTQFEVSLHDTKVMGTYDYLYFAIITLTSVGYGDLTPQNDIGQQISIAMALIGSGHMLVSVALLLDKINQGNVKS
ncbi:potassium channel family protein [Shewanella polaris]|nr:potassium channel family protein [Shewanella polaris]